MSLPTVEHPVEEPRSPFTAPQGRHPRLVSASLHNKIYGAMKKNVRDTRTPVVIAKDDGASFDFGGLAVQWKIDGAHTGGRFSVVHHPIAPHALAAPLHYHHNEDEYSFVLEGTLGALLGDEVVTAEAGTWVAKPREEWHTFWNAGDTPCHIIEVISPSGFEDYFREVADTWGDLVAFAEINAKYALEMDFESVPGLCERFGLTFPDL